MNFIINQEAMEDSINFNEGNLKIGIENSKMMLELAKTEKSFSLFLDFLGDSKESEDVCGIFESLRDKCVILAVRKIMMG